MSFHDFISNVIDLESNITDKKVKEILGHLEKARDVAVEIIKKETDIDTISILKRMFSIHSDDKRAKGLIEQLELEFWRIIK